MVIPKQRSFKFTNSSVDAPLSTQFREASADLLGSLESTSIWVRIGFQSLKSQYARTYLGPLWISIQIIILTLGLASIRHALNPHLSFSANVSQVGVGTVIVSYVTGAQAKSAKTFQRLGAPGHRPNLTSFAAFQQWFLQFLTHLHEFLPVLILASVFNDSWRFHLINLLIMLFSIYTFTLGLYLFVGVLGTRFRDLEEIIALLNRLQFILCPVFWVLSDFSESNYLISLTKLIPTTYFLVGLRESLFGYEGSLILKTSPIYTSFTISITCFLLGFFTFSIFRKKLSFWSSNR